MPLPTILLLYWFWLTEICICCKPYPTRDKTHDLQIALPTTLMLLFFYASGTQHARHNCTIFELWGQPFCLSLLVSFFWCCYERNSIHSASLSHFISLGSHHLFFLSRLDGCWIHINVGCFACIYGTSLVVSLNDEPWLVHWRQQCAGSVFQFHYKSLNITHLN